MSGPATIMTARRPSPQLLTAALVVGAFLCPSRPSAQALTLKAVLESANQYVANFVERFSNVVAEEHYTQNVIRGKYRNLRSTVMSGVTFRETRADFLLLRVGGPLEWRPYRDVFEVDGAAVRQREERLTQLFARPSPSSYEQAARIAQASARYNIGLQTRTVNTPVLALLFLQASIQPRFQFKFDRRDYSVGKNVWMVRYRERTRPTLIRALLRGGGDADLPASGRVWIEAPTGTILKTDLVVGSGTMTASIVTSYRHDERFGIAVPFQMEELYTTANDRLTGTATYENFRQFHVETGTEVKQIEATMPAGAGTQGANNAAERPDIVKVDTER